MARVIDTTYFEGGKLAIPGAVSQPSVSGNAATSVQEITGYIERYEPEYMKLAIGHFNYETLQDRLTSDPNFDDPANANWGDLVNGKQYQYEGKRYCWPGLRQVNGVIKGGVIASYVFCKYFEDDQQQYTSTGMQQPNADNSIKGNPNLKLTQVWRDFIEMHQGGLVASNYPKIIYNSSGGVGLDWYGQGENPTVSLYTYLEHGQVGDSLNPDYTFHLFENRNSLGI